MTLRELWSNRLFGHDIRNILACLDVHNSNDAILYTFLQKSNFDSYMFYSLMRKIVSSSGSDCSCVVLLIIVSCSCLHCISNKSALICFDFTTSLASAIVSAIAVHNATVDCFLE
jgi:hypothetical protein